MGCIVDAHMKLQEPDAMMMVSSHILSPLPEPLPLQIMSITFEAEGFCLGPQQLKELKTLSIKGDKLRTKAMAYEDWHGLLDHT